MSRLQPARALGTSLLVVSLLLAGCDTVASTPTPTPVPTPIPPTNTVAELATVTPIPPTNTAAPPVAIYTPTPTSGTSGIGGIVDIVNPPGGLQMSVPTIEGTQYSFAAQAGKPMLMLVSASWCTDCLTEIPKLARLYTAYQGQGLQVVALDLDTHEGADAWKGFKIRGKGGDHVWALDPGNKVTLALGVQSTDTKIIFNRQGKEIFRTMGTTPYDVLDQNVKEALK